MCLDIQKCSWKLQAILEGEVSLATVLCCDVQLASVVIMTAADNRRDERVL
jgi:hypothetical protein